MQQDSRLYEFCLELLVRRFEILRRRSKFAPHLYLCIKNPKNAERIFLKADTGSFYEKLPCRYCFHSDRTILTILFRDVIYMRFCAQVVPITAPSACTVSVTLDFKAVAWIQGTHKLCGASDFYFWHTGC